MSIDTAPTNSERLRELRGSRTLREIANVMRHNTNGRVDVTPQAISNWEKKGFVPRKHADAYDDALGAGGAVLAMSGHAPKRDVGLTTIDEKLDLLIELVRELHNSRRGNRHNGADTTPSEMPRPALRRGGPR